MGSQYRRNTSSGFIKKGYKSTLPSSDTPSTLSISDIGDIQFEENKNLYFVSKTDKIKQDLYIILKSIKGSSPYNPLLGLDVLTIIKEEYDPQIIETEITKSVMMHPEITSIKGTKIKMNDDYRYQKEENRLNYVEFYVTTVYGNEIFISVAL
jgi:phage baseplate assembly protein W